MTKKHFIALADMIRRFNASLLEGEHQFDHDQLLALASFCQTTNPRFKANRWLSYIAGECGSSGGTIKKAKAD